MDRDRALEIQRTALRDWIAIMAEASPGARLFERDGIAAEAAPACPERSIANSVTYRDSATLSSALDELAAFYADAGVEAWTVWAPEFDREAIAALEAAGHAFDGKPLAMTLELDRWQAPELGDLEWGELGNRGELGRVNDLAYGLDPAVGFGRALSTPPARYGLYEARVDGETGCVLGTIAHPPSAGAEGGDLGFYFVATDPRHRGRGLCSRLMAALLLEAREQGFATASLQASGMGEPIYLQLGFEPHFRLHLYERRGAD